MRHSSLLAKLALPFAFSGSLAAALCAPFATSIAHAQVVVVDPPAPQEEIVPPLPYAGAVWTPGYWEWRGRKHFWVGGRYVAGRPGYGWRRHEWRREGGGWRMHAGGWERHR